MTKERHKTKFIIGDRVVIINVGRYTGAKGEVDEIKGFINEKYIVKLDTQYGGAKTIPLKSRYLTRDKRNN